jgi:hypothetical protein
VTWHETAALTLDRDAHLRPDTLDELAGSSAPYVPRERTDDDAEDREQRLCS